MFISAKGASEANFEGHALVIPSLSVGQGPVLGTDLWLLNQGYSKAGFFYSKHVASFAGDEMITTENPSHFVTLSSEVWTHAEHKLTFLVIRSGIGGGRSRLFLEELKKWREEAKFTKILLAASTFNPIRKIRASNA